MGYALPSNILRMMEQFGRFERNPQGSGEDPGAMGSLMAELAPFASTDPKGFLEALTSVVLPVGGWAVYGASRTIWEFLSVSRNSPFSHHPAYIALMNAALDFLRANGVPPMMVSRYEWDYWLDNGGTMDTWLPRQPTPSPAEAPINELLPGEVRRVAQMTSAPDSNVILVRQGENGQYAALIDAKWSDEDPRRVQNPWKSAGSLYDLYIQIGLSLQTPWYWCDRELEPYFPLPRPRI